MFWIIKSFSDFQVFGHTICKISYWIFLGSCVLQPEEMARNNIRYNKSTEVENGQTIEFECEAKMVPENDLKATCENEQIRYPKCSVGRKFKILHFLFFLWSNFWLNKYNCIWLHPFNTEIMFKYLYISAAIHSNLSCKFRSHYLPVFHN